MKTENLNVLKINTLTHKQYEKALAAGDIKDNELYLTTNNETYLPKTGGILNGSLEVIDNSIKIVSDYDVFGMDENGEPIGYYTKETAITSDSINTDHISLRSLYSINQESPILTDQQLDLQQISLESPVKLELGDSLKIESGYVDYQTDPSGDTCQDAKVTGSAGMKQAWQTWLGTDNHITKNDADEYYLSKQGGKICGDDGSITLDPVGYGQLYVTNDKIGISDLGGNTAMLDANVGGLPTLKLSQDNGEHSFKITCQGVEGTDAVKESWKTWLEIPEIPDSTSTDISPIIDGNYALGSLKNKSITYLRTAIKNWLDQNLLFTSASAHFYADNQWIDMWNTEEVDTPLNTGSKWTATVVAPYNTSDYVQLRISTYGDKKIYYTCCRGGKWEEVHQVAFAEDVYSAEAIDLTFAEISESLGVMDTHINNIESNLNSYLPKQDSGGMYVIDTPLNVKTNKKDNYFINKSGDSSLNIRSDVANGTASLNLGQNSKSKYGLRVRPNTDDPNEPPRFDIYDFTGNKSIAIVKSVEEIKLDAFENGNGDTNSGMYIGSAVWPEGKQVTSAADLDYSLAKVIHERNIDSYLRDKYQSKIRYGYDVPTGGSDGDVYIQIIE